MLEHLSSREFEEYCQLLMMALHRCRVDVTQQTRDGGRDLFVHHSTGLWIVECKHWPTGTVGRPVVQKLHSVTLTSNSCRALIVTTGRFSQDAENYAQSLTDIVVELIDMAKLAHMISVAFPNGALPTNLSVAIKTTPDATFAQIFAQSIFSPDRFQRGTSPRIPSVSPAKHATKSTTSRNTLPRDR
jgi:restriction system protein